MEVTNKYIVVKHHIDDAPEESHFELKTGALALSVAPGSDDIIVKNLYISIDPYQINRMKSCSPSHGALSASTPISPGEVVVILVQNIDIEIEVDLSINLYLRMSLYRRMNSIDHV